jgi:hypothetical protein
MKILWPLQNYNPQSLGFDLFYFSVLRLSIPPYILFWTHSLGDQILWQISLIWWIPIVAVFKFRIPFCTSGWILRLKACVFKHKCPDASRMSVQPPIRHLFRTNSEKRPLGAPSRAVTTRTSGDWHDSWATFLLHASRIFSATQSGQFITQWTTYRREPQFMRQQVRSSNVADNPIKNRSAVVLAFRA